MATTIKDIAKSLGVAPSTVTRALGGSPRIGDEMKQRVNALAMQMNYVPSAAAQTMRSQSSNIVGFIVPDVENNDVATIAKEIAGCCSRIGFQLVLALHNDDPQAEYEHLRALVSARAAAVVAVPTETPLAASLALLERQPTIQVIRQVEGVASSNFACDDAAGTREAAEHLLALGHRRIAYLGNSLLLSTGRDRLKGFRAARSPVGLMRKTDKTVITTYGRDTAVASTLFYRENAKGRVGRQMQTWVRFPEGWRIVAAHVSVIDEPKDSST